jgi:hypothetical protein
MEMPGCVTRLCVFVLQSVTHTPRTDSDVWVMDRSRLSLTAMALQLYAHQAIASSQLQFFLQLIARLFSLPDPMPTAQSNTHHTRRTSTWGFLSLRLTFFSFFLVLSC